MDLLTRSSKIVFGVPQGSNLGPYPLKKRIWSLITRLSQTKHPFLINSHKLSKLQTKIHPHPAWGHLSSSAFNTDSQSKIPPSPPSADAISADNSCGAQFRKPFSVSPEPPSERTCEVVHPGVKASQSTPAVFDCRRWLYYRRGYAPLLSLDSERNGPELFGA